MRNKVRELRRELGLSQQKLATILGVSRQTVNAIETGRYNPALPLAFALARFFGRAVEEIFQPDDPAGPDDRTFGGRT
ncbi:helix-turn-helix transcriptional regulator [Kitasatospora sp. NBC_00070]|uniref:helix-turn-helix transcriptional regulator n=1 Tax=Kitasatospora sp. NBC_00070 TaxID=2975962 RepID=UPI0032449AC6